MLTRENPRVDLDDLHNDWVEIPVLIMQVCSEIADKIGDKDYLFSRLAKKLRKADEKISQAKLESKIKEDEEYIEVEIEINKLKAQLEGLQAAKRSLENNVILWKEGYWSSPNEQRTKGGNRPSDRKTEDRRERQRDRLNKNRGE